MRRINRLLASGAVLCAMAWGQQRTVAITVDDLPYVHGEGQEAVAANKKLLAAFAAHRVPVTGFVIQSRVEILPPILPSWIRAGFDLGNHTYSHSDINDLSVAQIEKEIVDGEKKIKPLMEGAGKRLTFFRFPMNHTGDTKEKHDAIAAFLADRGYQLATCTIDTSDYVFNNAYVRALQTDDRDTARKVREEYLAYSAIEIDYYAGLNRQVLGYEQPEVMLLHDNRLNSEVMDTILHMFEERGYRFVTLAAAQSDAAYRTPEWITKYGWMWAYRWARQRQMKVNGSLEKEPPQWVLDYAAGKKAAN